MEAAIIPGSVLVGILIKAFYDMFFGKNRGLEDIKESLSEIKVIMTDNKNISEDCYIFYKSNAKVYEEMAKTVQDESKKNFEERMRSTVILEQILDVLKENGKKLDKNG